MEFPKAYKVNVAAKDYSQHDMSKTFVTTQDFGVIKPLECKICFPGDKLRVNVNNLTRLLTMPAPTYGSADMILRAFFVPLNTFWKQFDNFISNNLVPDSEDNLVSPQVPYLYQGDIVRIFLEGGTGMNQLTTGTLPDGTSATVDNSDVHIIEIDDDSTYSEPVIKVYHRFFTYEGRKFYDFLTSLGLKFSWFTSKLKASDGSFGWIGNASPASINYFNNTYGEASNKGGSIWRYSRKKISLLPVLAFWKFYLDWVVPSRYLNNYVKLRYTLDYLSSGRYGTDDSLEYNNYLNVLSQLPVSFLQDDFFTTLFSSSYGYEDNKAYSTAIKNDGSSSLGNVISSELSRFRDNNGAKVNVNKDNENYLNMFSLQSLGALQDMVNRGKIAGSKVRDYLRVTYGITPSNDALHISTYLGSKRIPISFDSVESKSDTYDESTGKGALLGQTAGHGSVGNDAFQVSYDCDGEHGFFFITSEIQVKTSYTQGLAPEFELLDRLDFFQPELDSKGVEAVPYSMLMADSRVNASSAIDFYASPDKIFGYAPRYAKFKVNFDNVSGDFLVNHLNTGLDSWYLTRDIKFSDLRELFPMINEKFCQALGDGTSSNYDRIFSVDNNSIDHFYSVFHIDATFMRKMKSLREGLEFTEGGKPIDVSFNGSIQN